MKSYRLKSLVQKVAMLIRMPVDYGLLHPHRGLHRRAHEDTLDFIEAEMPKAIAFQTPRELLLHALELAPAEGLVLEFGVFQGKTVNLIAERLGDRRVDGFDSFEGLPETWEGNHMAVGYFATEVPRVRSNVRLHAGWFDETLPDFVRDNEEPIAFVHVDCDLYASTATIFEHIEGRLAPGAVLLFDEYFNYPRWREHEHRAFIEMIGRTGRTFEYVAYAYAQVAVVMG